MYEQHMLQTCTMAKVLKPALGRKYPYTVITYISNCLLPLTTPLPISLALPHAHRPPTHHSHRPFLPIHPLFPCPFPPTIPPHLPYPLTQTLRKCFVYFSNSHTIPTMGQTVRVSTKPDRLHGLLLTHRASRQCKMLG
jgi:hypothetical protein